VEQRIASLHLPHCKGALTHAKNPSLFPFMHPKLKNDRGKQAKKKRMKESGLYLKMDLMIAHMVESGVKNENVKSFSFEKCRRS
jgi:hypothetical protein